MKNLIVNLAYRLESSKRYYTIKHFVYETLEDDTSLKKRYFDFFMIFLVLSTVAILIYEVNNQVLPWLDMYESFAIFVFIIEWLCRLWVSSHSRDDIIKDYEKSQLLNQPYYLSYSLKKIIKKKFSFIVSPMSIIDLLAILPHYRPLRILRILMLFRLFKILRYTNSITQFRHVFSEKKFEFLTLLMMFCMVIVFGSTIIFIYEGAGINPNIQTFFDAVYWTVITVSTVGFGDISPVTIQGRIATIFLVMAGMGVIAFSTSIVTTALTSKLGVLKDEKVVAEANSMSEFVIVCGYGRMGSALIEQFKKVKQKFIIVDQDEKMIENHNNEKVLSIKGDATNPKLLESLGVQKGASTVVAITDDDAVNLSIILTVRSLNTNINIIARANDVSTKKKLYLAGANEVVLSNEISALVAAEYIGQPVAFEAIEDILISNEAAVMEEIEVVYDSGYIGSKLEAIDFSKYNLTLIGVIDAQNRKKFKFNPKKDQYVICSSDILIVIGYKESIKKLKIEILSGKPYGK